MGVPNPNVTFSNSTRHGVLTLECRWTTTDADDLDQFIVLDPTRDVPAHYDSTRIAIEWVEWNIATSGAVEVRFDAVGDRSVFLSTPEDTNNGRVDFTDEISGSFPDPDKENPSDIVMTTSGVLPGDRVWLRIGYKIKGVHKAMGITVATAAIG